MTECRSDFDYILSEKQIHRQKSERCYLDYSTNSL